MSEEKKWQFELDEYIKQGEPEQAEKSEAWQIAIGLQQVDGLKTSEYLLDTAKKHIEGKISIKEAQRRIYNYYEERTDRMESEPETQEADIVSARIAELLVEKTFQFSYVEWMTIHRRIFEGVFDHAGRVRTYNITKKEWVLNGVFIIKYMRTFGLKVENDAFKKHSWYFRNALVRANYNNLKNGIHATTKYLELFFSNLLMGTTYELKNRYMHIDYVTELENQNVQSAIEDNSKGKNCTLNCTLDELAILKMIIENPSITQKELAIKIGKSERTIKTKVSSLKEKGYIQRLNGKRNGIWQVLVDLT